MEDAMPVDKKLFARKEPSQQRSRQTVEKILDAARKLVKETSAAGSSRTTTNEIAKEAGISVGSLYQYFPNTEAIVFAVYREMLEQVQKILDEFDSLTYLSLPREEFFNKLSSALTKAEPDTEIVLAMLNVPKQYPLLAEEERRHAERTSTRIAEFLRHFGSSWPINKLQRLVLFMYYMDHGVWMYRDHVKPVNKEVLDWEASIINFMMMQCFE
jgi:AcrR family transcriptional regulator